MKTKTFYPAVISFRLTSPVKKSIKEICRSEGLTYSQLFRRLSNELILTKNFPKNDEN